MCGILGLFSPSSGAGDLSIALQKLHQRGPDSSGEWRDDNHGIALGHTRLSIMDLSSAGSQPMHSTCGRYVLAFNGEIYNHLVLREALGSEVSWRGHSDTETLLTCIATWGLEQTLGRVVGMFAFCLWDKKEQQLALARDRIGEKPLYYGWNKTNFTFASEIKALMAMPDAGYEIDREAVLLFMRHGYVPSPKSIFKDVFKLKPGSYLIIKKTDVSTKHLPQVVEYWSAREKAESAVSSPDVFTSDKEAVDKLEELITSSVGGQMLSDVPLGSFLSGGIDSSTVTALMQSQSSEPIQTYSIGFSESNYDEAVHAKAVAKHLGTDHTEWYITPNDALDVIPTLNDVYSEPFADSSQIPTILVSRLARQSVTVALSGDGGDELFGGYNRYFIAARLWGGLSRMPLIARKGIAGVTHKVPIRTLDAFYHSIEKVLPDKYRMRSPGEKLHKAARVIAAHSEVDLYEKLISEQEVEQVVIGAGVVPGILSDCWLETLPSLMEKMMVADVKTYLPDDILVKVDRAAMSESLETRVPLIDHRIYEFAWKLPMHLKIRDGQGKWILRQVLYKHVPQEIIDRPKMGFGIPVGEWLKGSLRDWAESLLEESKLEQEGIFDASIVRGWWLAHLDGSDGLAVRLWYVLMFRQWHENLEIDNFQANSFSN